MATNKLDKICSVDFKFICARNVSVEILMAQERQIEKAHRHMINKTLGAIRDADSRQQ
jgi:hypothetical protein